MLRMSYGFHFLPIWRTILCWKDAPLGMRFEITEIVTLGLDGVE